MLSWASTVPGRFVDRGRFGRQPYGNARWTTEPVATDFVIWVVCFVALISLGCSAGAPQRGSTPNRSQPADSNQALELYRQGRYAEAEPLWVKVTAERPGDAQGWAYLGLTRVHLDKPRDAEAALTRALTLDADNAEAHYGMGLARLRTGRLDEAISELERAIRSNPTHAYAHYHLGLAYNQRGRKDRTVVHLQRFLELEPNAPEAPSVRALLARLS